jgi:cation diffusion facilitator CzcD-associated flavoprotein CzcO
MSSPAVETDVIVVGTGFSGLGMGVHLKRSGRDFLILERAEGIGGTWRDNTYPGAACDIQSHLYSFSFAINPDWSRIYSPQTEILAYLESVAADEGLEPHIVFGAEVLQARWDEDRSRWIVSTARGEFSGRVLITASGHLSDPKLPELEGLDEFAGPLFHSARWDHSATLAGRRIGVIGTGASAIQVVPAIAPEAGHVTVFQRSAPWIVPRNDRPYSDAERRMFRRVPARAAAVRETLFWQSEARFPQRLGVSTFIDTVQRMASDHLERQVGDPELRHELTPNYAIGCKRILRSDDYYPSLLRPDVYLETTAIERVGPHEVVLCDGRRTPLDVLIVCTGFEATDLPIAHRIRGRDDTLLADHWADGGQAYACTTVSGFPNLFVMLGPNTGLGAGSVIFMAEVQMSYIMGALSYMDQAGGALEITSEAERRYVAALDRRSAGTVWLTGGCNTWYVDERSGRQTTLWPDFMSRFRFETAQFTPDEYRVMTAVTP